MPDLSTTITDDVVALKKAYKGISKSWYRRWFFPSALTKALNDYHPEAVNAPLLPIVNAMRKNVWFFHKWLFPSIAIFSASTVMQQANRLRDYSDMLDSSREHLKHLVNETIKINFDEIMRHSKPEELIAAFYLLGPLSDDQANRKAVFRHRNPIDLAKALGSLHRIGLLKSEHGQANRDAVAQNSNPQGLLEVLCTLHRVNLLNTEQGQANSESVVQYNAAPHLISNALNKLDSLGLLNAEQKQANFEALIKVSCLATLVFLLEQLEAVRLITPANAQKTFDVLIRHADILLDIRVYSVYQKIPDHLWTQRHFTHLVNICSLDEMSIEQRIPIIQRYVNEVILRSRNESQAFNPPQSTHTASVHQSVSESAKRLINRYPLTAKQSLLPIKALQEWATSLVDTDFKTLAAKRAIIRITANDYNTFIDSTSGVSMKQLLALAWTAMNDVDNLVMGASAQEAKNRFLQCLYEIQRGYNIDEQGNDDHQDDKPICTAGTFNKLIEALSGVHQDCHIVRLSIQQASAKLPIIVREEALKYIEANNGINKEECSQQLEQHGLMMIIKAGITLWEAIKANVIYRVKDEFGFLFKEKDALEEFVDNGKETDCQLLQNALSSPRHLHRFFQPQQTEASSSISLAPEVASYAKSNF